MNGLLTNNLGRRLLAGRLWRGSKKKAGKRSKQLKTEGSSSVDLTPWDHPFLCTENLQKVRRYSADVWQFATEHSRRNKRDLDVAFAVNIAQNAYKWARLACEYGASSTLYLHPLDNNAISMPQWEEFDGSYTDIHDGKGFLELHGGLSTNVTCRSVPMDGDELIHAARKFSQGDRKPLLRILSGFPQMRLESLTAWEGIYPYFRWASESAKHDVTYAVSVPIAAYLSGRPYCVQSIGGELQYDCGRNDDYGRIMSLACNAARFLTFTNPDKLSHCRRLGLTNGLYVPYPMDDHRYCPGEGRARKQWEAQYGEGVFLLSTSRIDNSVKGNGLAILDHLAQFADARPHVKFVFLNWGHHASQLKEAIESRGLQRQFIFLPAVGKRRLVDYYRSCDAVLDQFVFGYYGATGLEAAACGKPVVMRMRTDHYRPLYDGDIAPVDNVLTVDQLIPTLTRIVDNRAYRHSQGIKMRQWLVRNHGRARTVPLMLALLQLAADQKTLPSDLVNPLVVPETEEETAYHRNCVQSV